MAANQLADRENKTVNSNQLHSFLLGFLLNYAARGTSESWGGGTVSHLKVNRNPYRCISGSPPTLHACSGFRSRERLSTAWKHPQPHVLWGRLWLSQTLRAACQCEPVLLEMIAVKYFHGTVLHRGKTEEDPHTARIQTFIILVCFVHLRLWF